MLPVTISGHEDRWFVETLWLEMLWVLGMGPERIPERCMHKISTAFRKHGGDGEAVFQYQTLTPNEWA